MAAQPAFSLLKVSRWADSLGAAGALLCALHCAMLPVALALLPAVGSGVLSSQAAEVTFSLFATVLAIGSLWQGYRSHRAYRAWLFVAPGLGLIWLGLLWPSLHQSVLPHAFVMALGGTLIATAHLANLRLSHGHHHDACCAP